jgi:starvation-inducible DNA-binding protein
LTLGETPVHNFSDYVKHASIKEAKDVSHGKTAVQLVVDGFQKLLVLERELLELSSVAGDEGTNALMSDYIREQEKTVWMYNSFLTK